ncbi:uncharacterized protein LOC133187419 [Saccostrea echinata]|uniref:uncharacterized protein LOC133187419 n=1 Tax=Saccostrea echinata TaxID=191078 RepID=UPI002A7F3A81|nr:uncharacterized protein LOC133187419 [Saccostrea echinata]
MHNSLKTLSLVLKLFLICFSVEGFLLQDHQPHQNASDEQKALQILTRLLPSLTTHPEIVVNEICKAYPSLIFPHLGECQLYYNCSMTYSPVPSNMEQHMMECTYPDLFSERTLQCENFTDVCCGARQEIKDKCSYRMEKTRGQCFSPSCVGKLDGMIGTTWNSYMICLKERLLGVGSCDTEELPYKGKCTSRLEVPKSEHNGGLLPSCEKKVDGIYRFIGDSSVMNFGDYIRIGHVCDAYYRCDSGNITVVRCPNGTVFHSDVGVCKFGNSSLPEYCQLYCNPYRSKKFNGCFPPRIAECPPPLQFSERTKQCENFTEVNCGSRTEIKYYCNYWYISYLYRNGGHCSYDHPKACLRLPNGLFKHPSSFSQKAFIRCYQNRLVEEGQCSFDPVWFEQTYPYNGSCTQRFAIPASDLQGVGLLPDCTGRPDGSYQFITRPCDAYYRCDSGNATAIKCPDHTYFDKNSGRCSSNAAC